MSILAQLVSGGPVSAISTGTPFVGADRIYVRWGSLYPTRGITGVKLSSAPRCGGSTKDIETSAVSPVLFGAAGGVVYWLEDALHILDEATGEKHIVDVDSDCVHDLEGDAQALYYLDGCQGAVVRVAHGDVGQPLVTGVFAEPGADLAVSSTRIFIAMGNDVLAAPSTGGAATMFHMSASPIDEIVADEHALYVSGRAGNDGEIGIERVDLATGWTTTIESAAGSYPVLSEGLLYWSKPGSDERYDALVRTSSATPGTPEIVLPRSPERFAVAAGRIYWFEGPLLLSARGEQVPDVDPANTTPFAWERRLGSGARFHALASTSSGHLVALATFNEPMDLGAGQLGTVQGGAVSSSVAMARFAPDGSTIWSRTLPRTFDGVGLFDLALAPGPPEEVTTILWEPGVQPTLFRIGADSSTVVEHALAEGVPGTFGADAMGRVRFGHGEFGSSGSRQTVRGLDELGAEVWQANVGDLGIQPDLPPLDIGVSADGGAAVLISDRLVRFSADGTINSTVTICRGVARQAVPTIDGGVLLVGTAEDAFDVGLGPELVAFPGRTNVFLVRYDANGAVLWSRSYRGWFEVMPAAHGTFLALGRLPTDFSAPGQTGNFSLAPFVARLDTDLDLLWTRAFPESPLEISAAAADRDGGAFIGGRDTTLSPAIGYLARFVP